MGAGEPWRVTHRTEEAGLRAYAEEPFTLAIERGNHAAGDGTSGPVREGDSLVAEDS
jgi:hypothetical protein